MGTLKQRAYSYIYQKLSDGDIGPGDRLSGRALAKEIGVSPIPVRDAIIQLSNEGFIVTHPDGRNYVPEPSYEQLMDIYDQREALECHAVARVAESSGGTYIEEFEACIDKLSRVLESLKKVSRPDCDPTALEAWAHADAAFHDSLLRAAANRITLETVKNLRTRTRIFGKRLRYEPLESIQRAHEEHGMILDRIRHSDPTGAQAAMREHIRRGCRLVIEAHHRHGLQPHSSD